MNFDETFPLIYCLNLAKRQDRRVRCEEVFELHNLRVWRFPAVEAGRVRHARGFETAGRYAHAVSTRLIIRRAMQAKAPAVFIFEDDVVLADDWRTRLSHIELPEDWGLFYLGCQHHERPTVASNWLVRVTAALDTHAWGVRSTHYRRVLRALSGQDRIDDEVRPAADISLARLHRSIATYAPYPQLAWQHEEDSDLLGGIYSSYTANGEQKWTTHALKGLVAEVWGGKACSKAVSAARNHVAWFRSSSLLRPLATANLEAALPTGLEAATPTEERQLATSVRPAFLFVTRGDINHPDIWLEYFSAVRKDSFSVLAHAADLKAVRSRFVREAQISERIETSWGSISLVRLMLCLLRAGLADKSNTHFVFLSESCVPIRPLEELRRVLALDGRSRFHWETRDEIEERLPDKGSRISAVLGLPHSMGRFHSQWLLLNREAAELVVEDDFTGHFEKSFAPDEYYFGTVLEIKGWPLGQQVARHDVTWTDWAPGLPHPRTFVTVSAPIAAELAATGRFFARKFACGSGIGDYGLHRENGVPRPAAGTCESRGSGVNHTE